jgi:hypothetical protein
VIRLNHERLNIARKPCSGDRCGCARCKGYLEVANTRVKETAGVRVQYLACNLCSWRPENNKLVIPLEFAPPRKARTQ